MSKLLERLQTSFWNVDGRKPFQVFECERLEDSLTPEELAEGAILFADDFREEEAKMAAQRAESEKRWQEEVNARNAKMAEWARLLVKHNATPENLALAQRWEGDSVRPATVDDLREEGETLIAILRDGAYAPRKWAFDPKAGQFRLGKGQGTAEPTDIGGGGYSKVD